MFGPLIDRPPNTFNSSIVVPPNFALSNGLNSFGVKNPKSFCFPRLDGHKCQACNVKLKLKIFIKFMF